MHATVTQRLKLILIAALAAVLTSGYLAATRANINPSHAVGDTLDTFNGVAVYYNGGINVTSGRRTTPDGYNLGLKFQCVEFVKRYYHARFGHRMPQSMGHAKSFFAPGVPDGQMNRERRLLQFHNGAGAAPQPEDLVVFAPWVFNPYGHVAIVSDVGPDHVEVIQQNPGPFGSTRERYPLVRDASGARIAHDRLLGWLRVPPPLVAGNGP